MTEINQDNLEKAFEMLEAGSKADVVLTIFPAEREEILKLVALLDYVQKKREKIEAPKEILQEILENNEHAHRASGRSSVQENFNKIIKNLNFMNQKLKLSLSALGVILVIAVGIIAYQKGTAPEVAIDQTKTISETKLTTTSPVIGDAEIDASINEALDEVMDDTALEAEFADIELALSEETELNQINNLFDDNEL